MAPNKVLPMHGLMIDMIVDLLLQLHPLSTAPRQRLPTPVTSHFSTKAAFSMVAVLGLGAAAVGLELWTILDPVAEASTVGTALMPSPLHFRQALHWIIDRHQHSRNLLLGLLQEVFEVEENRFAVVLEAHKRRSQAPLAPAACPPNPVNIVLDFFWHVIIYHVLYAVEVETLSGYIGGT
jgi:hypothetical protein